MVVSCRGSVLPLMVLFIRLNEYKKTLENLMEWSKIFRKMFEIGFFNKTKYAMKLV